MLDQRAASEDTVCCCLKQIKLCTTYLSDGHGAEDVEEDEGAVSVILAEQVAM